MKYAADSKREHDFNVAISQTVYISEMMAGSFDPIKSNPYARPVIEVPLTGKRREKLANNGIKALGMMLRQMNPKIKKPKRNGT